MKLRFKGVLWRVHFSYDVENNVSVIRPGICNVDVSSSNKKFWMSKEFNRCGTGIFLDGICEDNFYLK